jgi:NAD(P)-dependent dehydrogenase (short-subunit alcohol dehydrogenase family)
MSNLHGKSALVTGAQRGIGAAIARRLTRDGARVWINAVEELERGRSLAAELEGELVEADVSDPDQVAGMLERTGPLDVVVNNAADQTYQPVLEVERKSWDRTLAVNLTGALLLTRDAARSMPGGGAIVNVTSIHAFVALRGAAAYTASKAALVMLAAQAAVELGEQGIRVNAMALGAIDVQGAVRLRRPGAIRVTGTFRWVARRHSRGGRGGGCVPRIR